MKTIVAQQPVEINKKRINKRVTELPPSGIRKFFDLVVGREGVISLGVGEPDFVTPWHICEAGIHSLEIGHTNYSSNAGLLELREEISRFIQKNTNQYYDPVTEIVVTVGGSEAIDLALRAILEPNEEVIVIDPSFVSYAPLATLAGGIPVRLSTTVENQFKPRIEDLEALVGPNTKAVIINYPNNPTGAALSRTDIDVIADFILRYDLLLISDEIYLPLSYEREGISFAEKNDLRNNLVLIHGFSKAWAMTGWRLGFAVGPAEIIHGMTKIHQYSIMCPPTIAQYAAVEALRRGDEEVQAMREEYDRRRRFITHHFNRLGLDCFIPKGAFYVFPSIQKTGLTSEQFAQELLDKVNVAVVPGTAFGACGEGFVRCSYATSLNELKEAINRIESFLTKYYPIAT